MQELLASKDFVADAIALLFGVALFFCSIGFGLTYVLLMGHDRRLSKSADPVEAALVRIVPFTSRRRLLITSSLLFGALACLGGMAAYLDQPNIQSYLSSQLKTLEKSYELREVRLTNFRRSRGSTSFRDFDRRDLVLADAEGSFVNVEVPPGTSDELRTQAERGLVWLYVPLAAGKRRNLKSPALKAHYEKLLATTGLQTSLLIHELYEMLFMAAVVTALLMSPLGYLLVLSHRRQKRAREALRLALSRLDLQRLPRVSLVQASSWKRLLRQKPFLYFAELATGGAAIPVELKGEPPILKGYLVRLDAYDRHVVIPDSVVSALVPQPRNKAA